MNRRQFIASSAALAIAPRVPEAAVSYPKVLICPPSMVQNVKLLFSGEEIDVRVDARLSPSQWFLVSTGR